MIDNMLDNAILNNAEWCELVANSHRVTSQRLPSAWRTTEPMPPFYPNVVTTSAGVDIEEILPLAEGLPGKCGWKDSYADIDLTVHGFSIKFDAHWHGLSGSDRNVVVPETVGKVCSAKQLDVWIAAWGQTPLKKIIFTSELLSQNVQFVFRQSGAGMDSGLVLNQSENVIGISNAFGPSDGIADCIAYAVQNASGLPLVGYGSSDELADLKELGFTGLGKCRIWVR